MLVLNLFFASLLTFTLLRLTPGDPAEIMVQKIFVGTIEYEATEAEIQAARQAFDMDKSILEQYFQWLKGVCVGNFGVSYTTRMEVMDEIGRRLIPTLTLACGAMALSLLATFGLSTMVRIFRSRAVNAFVEGLILFSITMPNFYLALVLVLVFSVKMDWLPVSGYGGFSHHLLPLSVLAFSIFGFSTRLLNTSIDEVLSQEFILTARAKGLRRIQVFRRHTLRNALIPVVPYISIQFAHLLGGVVIIETLFSFPGLGKYLVDSINTRDMPAIQGCVVFVALMFSLANIAGDLILARLDPRIRFSE
jgi:peptide/nickel transport system permease protein